MRFEIPCTWFQYDLHLKERLWIWLLIKENSGLYLSKVEEYCDRRGSVGWQKITNSKNGSPDYSRNYISNGGHQLESNGELAAIRFA